MDVNRLYSWNSEPKSLRRDYVLLRRLIAFVAPYKKYFFVSIVLLLAMALLSLVKPVVMGNIASAAQGKNLPLVWKSVWALIGLVVLNQCLMVLQMYATQLGGAHVISLLREHLFGFIQHLRVKFFDETATGKLVTRMINDIDGISELFSSGTLNVLGDAVLMVGTFVCIAFLNVRLALVTLILLPILVFIANFLRKLTRKAYELIRVQTSRMNVLLSEQVFGLAVIQAYAQEKLAQHEFDDLNTTFKETSKKALFYEALMEATMEMASTMCLAAVFAGVVGKIPGFKGIPFGTIVIFTQYLRQFLEPVSDFSNKYNLFQNAMTCAERIFSLLDEKKQLEWDSSLHVKQADIVIDDQADAIVFDQVNFAYKEERPLFKGLSFSIKRGEKVALMGATGSGKSTVMHLLQRFYEPLQGRIFVFGQQSTKVLLPTWRKQFSLVPQELILFPGTLLSNIAIGEQKPDEEKVHTVINNLGITSFIHKRGGLLSPVDERGSNFSQGERQLISFARALYQDGDILLLDEATANIDSKTEESLQQALQHLLTHKTALVIAHRLSTAKYVDRILLFQKGELVEQGSHAELMAQKGLYYQLHQSENPSA